MKKTVDEMKCMFVYLKRRQLHCCVASDVRARARVCVCSYVSVPVQPKFVCCCYYCALAAAAAAETCIHVQCNLGTHRCTYMHAFVISSRDEVLACVIGATKRAKEDVIRRPRKGVKKGETRPWCGLTWPSSPFLYS